MQFIENYPLINHNTFGLKVYADSFFSFENEEELLMFLEGDEVSGRPKFILGGGSNVLFTKDYPGIIIHSKIETIQEIEQDTESITFRVGSGLEWDKFVEYCVDKKYYGIENLSLIPGNVGAAPVQNIGAYGTEIKDFIVGVTAYNLNTKEKIYFSNTECCFAYRNSVFKKDIYKDYIITTVDFKLFKMPAYKRKIQNYQGVIILGYINHYRELVLDLLRAIRTIKINFKRKAVSIDYRLLKNIFENSGLVSLRKTRRTIINKRNSKIPSPKHIGNVGSFFKNPIIDIAMSKSIKRKFPKAIIYPLDEFSVKISAGWLIKQVNLNASFQSNVGLYKDQTLIIINKGDATGKEIYDFSQHIVERVYDKFKILLEREVVVIK